MPFVAGTTTWTPEQIATLTQMWENGATSNVIARVLSMTKNKIIGKAHRLHLASRPSPIKRGGTPRKAPAPKAEIKGTLSPLLILPIAHVRAIPTAMPSRKSEPCCWPEGPRGDVRYCCAESVPGKPYCEIHMRLGHLNYGRAA